MFAAGYVVEQSHNWSTLYLHFYQHRTYISAQKDLKWSDGLAVIYIYHCRSTYKNYVRCACNLLFPREFPFTTLVQCVWVSVLSLFLCGRYDRCIKANKSSLSISTTTTTKETFTLLLWMVLSHQRIFNAPLIRDWMKMEKRGPL